MKPEKVAVICGVLGTVERLKRLVGSVKICLPACQFIVVGQQLSDADARWCKRQGLQLIRSGEPLSFAKFNNLAAKQASGDWLLLLNDDLELKPSFWQGMVEMAELDYDVLGAKLLYPDGKIQHYGKWFSLDWYPFHVLRHQPADHPQSLRPRAFPDVTFACAMVRKSLWDELGGLDESYINGFEDDDFCLKARDAGAAIGVHHLALATHWESQTTGQDNENKERQWRLFHREWVMSGRIQWALGMYQGWKFI